MTLFYAVLLGTVENHGNTKIAETVIFGKRRNFAKMPCFAVFLARMPGFCRFYVYYNDFSFLRAKAATVFNVT